MTPCCRTSNSVSGKGTTPEARDDGDMGVMGVAPDEVVEVDDIDTVLSDPANLGDEPRDLTASASVISSDGWS